MSELKVGDKIRILEDEHNCALVEKGDVLEVIEVTESFFETEAPRISWSEASWSFQHEDEGTGWEKYEGEK